MKKLLAETPLEIPARKLMRLWRGPQVEVEILNALRQVVQPYYNCVDVGAHAGDVLRQIVKLAPAGKHFAFEPLPQLNRRVTREFPGVSVMPHALSDKTGTVTFHHALGKPGWSGLKDRGMDVKSFTVPTARLDDLVTTPINFIKIDVEGAELSVMRGAERIIQTYHPAILFEHCRSGATFFETKPEDVFDFLQGYQVMTLNGTRLSREEFGRIFWAEEANDFLAT